MRVFSPDPCGPSNAARVAPRSRCIYRAISEGRRPVATGPVQGSVPSETRKPQPVEPLLLSRSSSFRRQSTYADSWPGVGENRVIPAGIKSCRVPPATAPAPRPTPRQNLPETLRIAEILSEAAVLPRETY